MALSEASKDMVYLRKLVSGLAPGAITGPSSLATDNTGARNLSYNPELHDKTKHIARRHFYVRDAVESMELSVPFVPTAENVADIFTKALKSKRFIYLRDLLMGPLRASDTSTPSPPTPAPVSTPRFAKSLGPCVPDTGASTHTRASPSVAEAPHS